MKWLVRQNPQFLVSFLLPDAVFVGEVDRELQAPSVTTDTLYRVIWQEEPIVLHVEFQLKHDDEMGRRLWQYAEGDNEWLKASFFNMHDFLKDTWVFQEVIKEGLEQGLQQGLQQGKKEGREEESERLLTRFVELRFPALLALAKQTVEQKKSVEQLQIMLDKLYQANTVEEAQAALLPNG
jgi:hypothetical protein